MSAFPDLETVKGTRGCVLIELGELSEGISLLTPLTSEESGPFEIAIAGLHTNMTHD